jgi:thioredoxin-like negative regulator of GroEL
MNIEDPPRELTSLADRDKDPRTAIARAGYLAHKGDMAAVRKALSPLQARELSLQGRLLLVRAHASLGDLEAARSVLESSPEADRDGVEAELRLASGDIAGAVGSLETVLSSRPGDYRLTVHLARAYLLGKRPKDALRAAEAASGIDLRDWEAFEVKSEACEALGLWSRAERARQRATHLMARCGKTPRETPPRGEPGNG